MRFTIIALILSFLIIFSNILAQEVVKEKIYSLLLIVFKNDTIILENISVEIGMQTHFPTTDTGYYVEIISTTNERLFKSNLGISFTIHYQIFPGEKIPNFVEELEKILIQIRLPYFDNADRIEIYHDTNLIFVHKICNFNNICESSKGENIINCREDCLTTTTTPQSKRTSTPVYIYLIIIGCIIIITLFLVYKIRLVR